MAKNIKGQKPDNANFECPYCGHSWIANRNDFKMIQESENWTRLFMPCPNCKRETSVYKNKLYKITTHEDPKIFQATESDNDIWC